jgi:hypothetical protein
MMMTKQAKASSKGKSRQAVSENGDDRDLETKLWAAADALRNNMDAAEYKHVVLGLIFLKYISDAFDVLHERLEADPDCDPEERDRPRSRWAAMRMAAQAGSATARRLRTAARRPRRQALRALATTSTTPPTSAMPASKGGIGTVFLSSAVASIGPTSSTFSFLVKENPPSANPATPMTMRMIPTIVPGFIPGDVPG